MVDDVLLHPREAIRFFDEVWHKNKFYGVADDIIHWSILQRRKTP
jgi:hypothetical protein